MRQSKSNKTSQKTSEVEDCRCPEMKAAESRVGQQRDCKGTYASVRPYRHTYGNYGIRLQTWTRVIVNRCICKIIARDLSLVAS